MKNNETPNPSPSLAKQIETAVIHHGAFAVARDRIQTLIDDAIAGEPRSVEFMYAPSRSGKSYLAEYFEHKYPSTRVNGRLNCPVLVVYIKSTVSPKDLTSVVMKKLKVPVPKAHKNAGALFDDMLEQLTLAKVRAVLFDEVSHLVEVGSRIPTRTASDWFKDLYELGPDLSLVLTGVPRLEKLRDSNEQLRNRAKKPFWLMPYRFDEPAERAQFAGCVMQFVDIFKEAGYTMPVPMNTLARHMYAASAGHVGLLSKAMIAVAQTFREPCELGFEQFREAMEEIDAPGDGLAEPFKTEALDMASLMRVLHTELDKEGIVLPPTSKAKRRAADKSHGDARDEEAAA